jgi:sugar lactone lactonase YvrE
MTLRLIRLFSTCPKAGNIKPTDSSPSMRLFRLSVAIVVAPAGVAAQQFVGIAAVDSANVARMAWSSAVRASRQKNTVAARAEIERAASAWPTQPAYVWNRVWFAAAAGDTPTMLAALRDYARMGLGRDLRDSVFDRFRADATFQELVQEHERNRSPLAASTVRLTMSDSTQWPEGVDYDARTGNFYVTSVRHRTVVEVTPEGRERDVWPRSQPGTGAVFAVRVDSRRGVLWATTSALRQMAGWTVADSGRAALLEVRIRDGAVLRRWDLPSGNHVLGDVAIGPAGDVFMSDSHEPVLYRLRRGRDSLEAIRSPLFRSLQGVALTPDGRVAYVADYSHGILRVDLERSSVTRVDESAGITTLGCDGIAWHEGSIVAIQNGVAPARVVRFTLHASGTRIVDATTLDRNWTVADEPTIGTIVGDDFVYVANSQWEKYDENGARVPGMRLARPVLLALKLR